MLFDCLGILCHAPQSHSSPIPMYLPLQPVARPLRKSKKNKINSNRKEKKYFPLPPFPPLYPSGTGKLLCVTVHPSVQTVLLANAHCVTGEVQGLWPWSTSILDPHWPSSQMSCCCLQSRRPCSYGSAASRHTLQQFKGVDIRVCPGCVPGWQLNWLV